MPPAGRVLGQSPGYYAVIITFLAFFFVRTKMCEGDIMICVVYMLLTFILLELVVDG